ncbi:MAG TPA: cytochrome c3 family protein [Myxococcota bacterium]|jgi:predicted CXXCH cytochrome family protein
MSPIASTSWSRRAGPVLAALIAAASLVGVAYATERHKVDPGETVETIAQASYGDAGKAALIRALNKIPDGEQPAVGAVLKIPGPTIYTVQAGETLQKIADRFLSGDGGAELLAEANNLAKDAKLKPGQVITVFSEVELRTANRSAEDLATALLGDPKLGARIRRYNGVADGGKLPGKVYIPLVGIEPRGGQAVAVAPAATPPVATPPVATPPVATPPVVAVVPPLATPPVATPPVATPPVATPPVATPPVAVVTPPVATPPVATPPVVIAPPRIAPPLDMTVPVTGKRATLSGFSHALHTPLTIGNTTIGCLVCHERVSPDSVLHKAPSKENCLICHKVADEMPAQLRKGQIKRLPLPMNHKLHVGDNGLDCTICHRNEPERALGIITNGHEACTVCHNAAGGKTPYVGGDVTGAQCTQCHGTVEVVDEGNEHTKYLRAHLMRPIGRVGDVSFTHMTHASFSASGAPGGGPVIDCKTCHVDAYTAENKEEISKVQMQGCLECHRQANAVGLTPPQTCSGCHVVERRGEMPTNEMILKKPIDHTAFFRRHHEDAARMNAPLCASCHVGADGADGNRCDTCHQQMKPRDHTAGFRDKVHGRESQIDPARCEICHRAERCESCHREIPKSHFPLNVWVDKGLHGSRGRLEMGACLTCHRFETTCQRCHTAVAK